MLDSKTVILLLLRIFLHILQLLIIHYDRLNHPVKKLKLDGKERKKMGGDLYASHQPNRAPTPPPQPARPPSCRPEPDPDATGQPKRADPYEFDDDMNAANVRFLPLIPALVKFEYLEYNKLFRVIFTEEMCIPLKRQPSLLSYYDFLCRVMKLLHILLFWNIIRLSNVGNLQSSLQWKGSCFSPEGSQKIHVFPWWNLL